MNEGSPSNSSHLGHPSGQDINIERAQRELGYTPAVDMAEGLARTLQWSRLWVARKSVRN